MGRVLLLFRVFLYFPVIGGEGFFFHALSRGGPVFLKAKKGTTVSTVHPWILVATFG